jgi:hypothetical protein
VIIKKTEARIGDKNDSYVTELLQFDDKATIGQ